MESEDERPAPPAKDGKGGGPDNRPFSLTVVVNGDDQKLQVKPDDVLKEVLEKALKKAQNAGQGPDAWEVKTEVGAPLDTSLTLRQLGIGAGTILFASLKVGAAG